MSRNTPVAAEERKLRCRAIAFKFNDSCLIGSLVALNFLEVLRFLGLKASAFEIDGLIKIFRLLSCSSFPLFVIRNLGGDLARLETSEHYLMRIYQGLNRNDKKIFVFICLSACLAPILRKDLVGMGIIFIIGNAEKINQFWLKLYSDYLLKGIAKSSEEKLCRLQQLTSYTLTPEQLAIAKLSILELASTRKEITLSDLVETWAGTPALAEFANGLQRTFFKDNL